MRLNISLLAKQSSQQLVGYHKLVIFNCKSNEEIRFETRRKTILKNLFNKDQENIQTSRCFSFHVKVWLRAKVIEPQNSLSWKGP